MTRVTWHLLVVVFLCAVFSRASFGALCSAKTSYGPRMHRFRCEQQEVFLAIGFKSVRGRAKLESAFP